jgi:hypothetical protein
MVGEELASPWLNISYQSYLHAVDLADLLGFGLTNPGYLALGLAGLGIWSAWRLGGRERETALFWSLVAVVFYLFALGPRLTIANQDTGIPLPYAVLQELPVFNTGRDPGRFTIVALLGVGVLVAFGMKALLRFWILDFGFWILKQGRGANPKSKFLPSNEVKGQNPNSKYGPTLLTALTVGVFLAITLSGFMAAAGDAQAVPPD